LQNLNNQKKDYLLEIEKSKREKKIAYANVFSDYAEYDEMYVIDLIAKNLLQIKESGIGGLRLLLITSYGEQFLNFVRKEN